MVSRVTERAERKVNASLLFVQSWMCSLEPNADDLSETICSNAHYNLLSCECLPKTTRFAPWSAFSWFLWFAVHAAGGEHLRSTTDFTFCCSVVLLRRIHGAAWQRLSLAELVAHMKVTLLSPPKNVFVSLFFFSFSRAAAICAGTPLCTGIKTPKGNQSGGAYLSTAKDWFWDQTIELSFLQFSL